MFATWRTPGLTKFVNRSDALRHIRDAENSGRLPIPAGPFGRRRSRWRRQAATPRHRAERAQAIDARHAGTLGSVRRYALPVLRTTATCSPTRPTRVSSLVRATDRPAPGPESTVRTAASRRAPASDHPGSRNRRIVHARHVRVRRRARLIAGPSPRRLARRQRRNHRAAVGDVDERCRPMSIWSRSRRKCLAIRLAVDQRAVGAAEVLEERVGEDRDDRRVLAADRGVRQADVVVRRGGRSVMRSRVERGCRASCRRRGRARACPSAPVLRLLLRQPALRPARRRQEFRRHATSTTEMLSRPPFWLARSTSSAAAAREVGALLGRRSRWIDVGVDHVGEPVGAQQVDVVGLDPVLDDVGRHDRLDAERARHQVLVERVLRLLRREHGRCRSAPAAASGRA